MTGIKAQLNLFYIALGFFTRIPMPQNIDFDQQKLNQASRYFPLVGWLIGIICALSYWLFLPLFSNSIAILLSMLVSILLTGCFHEDGLADTCDGLGGGWTSEKKLSIMKDSRLGTYGAVAIWFALSLKWAILIQIEQTWLAFLVAHPLSRTVANGMIYYLPYVSDTDTSKAKPLAEKMNKRNWHISIAIGAGSLLLIPDLIIKMLLLLIALAIGISIYLKKQIGGFTGDTLGATQQLSELTIYMVLLSAQVNV
ncbi:adenosylcobinamide-GDP ribazoletransferase [Aliikangiella maris]|uniref:Adenosylcobinamide-GDP ribazoletransferase n=2 Tax=Aliikangiella maris TaxID=3162458 RepID=A0ABV2BWA4_9GAMM